MSTAMSEIIERFDSLSSDEQQRIIELLKSKSNSASVAEKSCRTLFDAFNDRGMIGSITDFPPDYSTNPKYMEGFGEHDR
jgi:hypothetical protein